MPLVPVVILRDVSLKSTVQSLLVKTTVALHAVAQAQKEGIAAFIDAEHAMDPSCPAALGVNDQ